MKAQKYLSRRYGAFISAMTPAEFVGRFRERFCSRTCGVIIFRKVFSRTVAVTTHPLTSCWCAFFRTTMQCRSTKSCERRLAAEGPLPGTICPEPGYPGKRKIPYGYSYLRAAGVWISMLPVGLCSSRCGQRNITLPAAIRTSGCGDPTGGARRCGCLESVSADFRDHDGHMLGRAHNVIQHAPHRHCR